MITRALWVRLHRWVGLSMAGFLILVGLTGSILSFWNEINHWLTPELYPGPQAGVELDAATLARRAEEIVPQAQATNVYLAYPGSVMIGMEATDGASQLDFEFLHLDPIDGHERGRVTWHDLPRRKSDIMPFIYGLHMYIAMPGIGTWILGVVAILWTIDCFVGFYLTLPPPAERARKGFLSRWKPSWLIKRRSSFYRLNFDFHRAGGLWLWPMLFVFAWSSVYFLMPGVYAGVTGALLDYLEFDPPAAIAGAAPPMYWEAAQQTGRRLMAQQAREKGFSIDRDVALNRLDGAALYEYRVHSSLDVGDKAGHTSIYFDSRSGELKGLKLPTGERSGNSVTTWLTELHTANVFGLPYRIFVCAFGMFIALLSITGVYIWWRKRRARGRHLAGASHPAGPAQEAR